MDYSINDIVHQNLKRIAKEKKIKVGQIEKEISVSVGYLSRKRSKLSIDQAFKIASILEISLDELCKLKEPPHWIPETGRVKGSKYTCSECDGIVYSMMHIPYKKYPVPYPRCPYCLEEMRDVDDKG